MQLSKINQLEVMQDIVNQYDVLHMTNIVEFFEAPVTHLYQTLKQVARDSYEPLQRIIIVDTVSNTTDTQPFYNYLQQILQHLDITNCFILVVSNSIYTPALLTNARLRYSTDATEINHIFKELLDERPESVTNFNIPDSICIDPWISLEITPFGNITPCCIYTGKITDKTITNSSLLDIVRGPGLADLRQQFLSGHRPIGCSRCWAAEDSGKSSKRILDRYVFRDKLFDTNWNDTGTTDLVALDIKLKNTCNLSCRICNPVLSSKWYDEVSNNPQAYPTENLKNIRVTWTDDVESNLWKDLTKISQNIRYITLTGGEPLLDKSHARLLEYLIKTGASKEIYLHYNTNGTIYADKFIPLWEQFKVVELSFSIDNVQEKFEYERFGAVWEEVVTNIKRYQMLNSDIYKFNLYSTISALNILDVHSVYDFASEYSIPITLGSILDTPAELSLQNFTNKQKTFIINKLKNINDPEFQVIIAPVLTFIETSTNVLPIEKLINYLERTDRVRNQDFRVVYPELAQLLEII